MCGDAVRNAGAGAGDGHGHGLVGSLLLNSAVALVSFLQFLAFSAYRGRPLACDLKREAGRGEIKLRTTRCHVTNMNGHELDIDRPFFNHEGRTYWASVADRGDDNRWKFSPAPLLQAWQLAQLLNPNWRRRVGVRDGGTTTQRCVRHFPSSSRAGIEVSLAAAAGFSLDPRARKRQGYLGGSPMPHNQ